MAESSAIVGRDPLVQAAIDFQKLSAEAFGMQRKREDDDLQFQVPEKQWPENVQVMRQGQTVQGVPLPARPMLSIPSLNQPIRQVYNQFTKAHLGIHIAPKSLEANEETAEIIQGLYRQIEVDSKAYLARNWGADRAFKCGFGAYRVDVVYDTDTDDPDDLKVVIKRILRQSSVYWDPFAVEPDFCDQTRCLIVSWMSRAQFAREFPDSKMKGMTIDELIELQSQMPNFTIWNVDPVKGGVPLKGNEQLKWYDGANDAVCLAEFFYTEYEGEGKKKKPLIKWCKINALEVLETGTWNGPYIPIIPCVGEELQPFDTERRWAGMITPNKDAARVINYEVTAAVEKDSLATKAPWIGAVGQFKTNQAAWQLANVRNFPFLEYDPVAAGGHLAPPPQRNLDSPDLSSSIALIQLGKDALSTGTAVVDTSQLQALAKRKVAHQTLAGLSEENAVSQSQYVDNMAQITMPYEAKVVLSLLHLYNRKGRVVQIRNEDGTQREVMLGGTPFALNPKTKRPIAIPEGMQRSGIMPQGIKPDQIKSYDLSKGTYGVVVDIGKSYKTKAQEGSDALANVMANVPQLIPVIGDIWMNYQDFPGHKEAAERMKKMLPPQLQDSDDENNPETLKAQRDQAGMMVEQLSQQLQQMQKMIETEQIKAQADLEKAKLDGANKLEIARLNAANDFRIAALKVKAEDTKAQIAMLEKAALQDDAQRFEHAENAVDRAHEHATLDKQVALTEAQNENQAKREVGQSAVGHMHALEEGERSHEQEMERGEAEHQRGMESQTQAEKAAEKHAKMKPKAGDK